MMGNEFSFTLNDATFNQPFEGIPSPNMRDLLSNQYRIAIGYTVKRGVQLQLNLDNFQYRWLKANISSPSLGRDILAQITYLPTKKIEMYVRYRHRHKYESVSDDNFYDYISPKHQYNIRYNLTAQISSNIKIKSRIEYTGFHKFQNSEEGIIMVQDIIFKKINFPLTLMLRYAVFDTQGYNSRLYAFENDIP